MLVLFWNFIMIIMKLSSTTIKFIITSMKKFILYYSLSILCLEGAYSQIDISEAVIINTTRIVFFKDTVIDGTKERIWGIGTGFYFRFTNNEDTLSVHSTHICGTSPQKSVFLSIHKNKQK